MQWLCNVADQADDGNERRHGLRRGNAKEVTVRPHACTCAHNAFTLRSIVN